MDWTSILVAVITGGLSLIGVVVTVWASNNKLQHKLEVSQAVTDTKLEELTREVRTHNNFAQRVPVLETRMDAASKKIEALERAVDR